MNVKLSHIRLCHPMDYMNSPGQNTGVGSCSHLQRIFPTQGSNPGLPHCGQILYQPKPEVGTNTWSPDITGYQVSKIIWTHYPLSSFSFTQEHTSEQECPVEGTCEAKFQPVTAPTQEVSSQRIGHLCVNQHRLALTIMIAPALFLALSIFILIAGTAS